MRVPQPEGARGSLKWLQRAVNRHPEVLLTDGLALVEWRSPLAADDYAEYRDGAFLDLLGSSHLRDALSQFWPTRGPQWDALAVAGERVVLVEAKAHLNEFFSPPSGASATSLARIKAALDATRDRLGVRDGADWTRCFYQYANRLAHLDFLDRNGVDAVLLFVSFVNDAEMGGPISAAEWRAAFATADYALGLPVRHAFAQRVLHVFPDVSELK